MDTASKLIEIFVYLVETSVDNICEQFGQNDLDPNYKFDTLMLCLKENFENNWQAAKKSMQNS